MKQRIIIFEDNKNLLQTLELLLSTVQNIEVCGAFSDTQYVAERVLNSKADLVLMDLEIPPLNGIEATAKILEKSPETKVLIQTIFGDDDSILRAICAGASGYILKSDLPHGLFTALEELNEGGAPMSGAIASKVLKLMRTGVALPAQNDLEIPLTPREKELLKWLTDGLSYKMIADAAGISVQTVKTHLKNIYGKLQVKSVGEAVSKAIKDRLV